ncbi:RcpC/CpaB family pilus assembly protein [Kineosporia sp. A_224]|uniref:RcpC/CpaB family pilus assembly protein n=1 Tax=Kineosporia sp. A_224 TaxID=1962180 RepID=UPI000B4AED83|nr:RcpC/CpaB family pilus assembly protein [Kineosporia sp. A_224]
MGRRTLLLVAAVLLAAIGTGVLFLYVSSAGGSFRGGSGSSDGTVDVVAPTTALAAGTTIDDTVRFQLVRVDRALAEQAGMIGKVSALQGLVANQPLAALVPVTSAQFGGAIKQSTDLGLPPKDQMAITLEVEDPARVSSFLRPGSRVAVFVVDPETRPTAKRHEARLVLTDVVVLTIGTSGTIVNRSTATTGAGSNSRGSQSLVTFQVNQRQAGQLLVAAAEGDIHLTLLGAGTTPTLESFDQDDIRVP